MDSHALAQLLLNFSTYFVLEGGEGARYYLFLYEDFC